MIKDFVLTIQEVFYVSGLTNNLLSIGQLQEKGLTFLIKDDETKPNVYASLNTPTFTKRPWNTVHKHHQKLQGGSGALAQEIRASESPKFEET
ncbi:hypothetical protein V2J09_006596 [Rumex salicifolius]